MPTVAIPGTNLQYALINFDDRGRERTDDPDGGTFSRTILERASRESPTHVFLFSHGWKGDVPGAIDQYNRWIGALAGLQDDRAAMGAPFRPLFIGLHWPSQPWGEESLAAAAASFAASGGAAVGPVLDAAVAHFGGGDAVRAPLEVIFHAFEEDPAARVLPDHVIAAYQQLGAAIGFSAGAGADAPPDREGAPLDPQAAVRAERIASAGEAFGLAGTFRNGMLAGLRQASFWLMKHRARTVGEQGMHEFIARLQRATTAQVHLMGHSFGCIVVSSILGGPGGTGSLVRPVGSAVLVQGALSLWSYAETIPDASKPGYFRHVLKSGAVAGPIVTTQSVNDLAVSTAFPAAVGLVNEFDFGTELPKFGGIGTWGIQGTSVAEKGALLDRTAPYAFAPGRIYNLDGSRFIADHNAIDGPEVAHAIWQAAAAARGPQP
jgi:hypothetical protein